MKKSNIRLERASSGPLAGLIHSALAFGRVIKRGVFEDIIRTLCFSTAHAASDNL
jgi:hypothetical protein